MKKEMIFDKLKSVLDVEKILIDEPMKKHTTYKVGGPADIYVVVETKEDIANILKIAKENNVDYFVLGNGSNLLVSDDGYRGIIIKLGKAFNKVEFEDNIMIAGGGVPFITTSLRAQQNGFTGLEFAAGIPGTVGGAVYMNAGAYGGEIKDVILEATVINCDGEIETYTNEDFKFEYRKSILSEKECIVLEVKMKLAPGDKDTIKETMNEYNMKRKKSQPLDKPNAGSSFKRPEGAFPGKLIEDAGLKGYSIGGAQVSEKHANFIINKGEATAKDIMNLAKHIQNEIYKNEGIKLELEIKILGKI